MVKLDYESLKTKYVDGVGSEYINLNPPNNKYMLNYIKNYPYVDSIQNDDLTVYLQLFADTFHSKDAKHWKEFKGINYIDPDLINDIIATWKDDAIKAMREAYKQFRDNNKKDSGSPKKAWRAFVKAFDSPLFVYYNKNYSVPGVDKLEDEQILAIARIKYMKYGLVSKGIQSMQDEWAKMTENDKQTHLLFQGFLHRFRSCILTDEFEEEVLLSKYQEAVWESYIGPIACIVVGLLFYKAFTTILYLKERVGGDASHTGFVEQLYHLGVRSSVWKHVFGTRHIFDDTDKTDRIQFKEPADIFYESIYIDSMVNQLSDTTDLSEQLNGKRKELETVKKQLERESDLEKRPGMENQIKEISNEIEGFEEKVAALVKKVKYPTGHNYFPRPEDIAEGPYVGLWKGTRTAFDVFTSQRDESNWRWCHFSCWYRVINESLTSKRRIWLFLAAMFGVLVMSAVSCGIGYGIGYVLYLLFKQSVNDSVSFSIFLMAPLVIFSLYRWCKKRMTNNTSESENTIEIKEDEIRPSSAGWLRVWMDVWRSGRYVEKNGYFKNLFKCFLRFILILCMMSVHFFSVSFLLLTMMFFNLKSASGSSTKWINQLRLGLVTFLILMLIWLFVNVKKTNSLDIHELDHEDKKYMVNYWEVQLIRHDYDKYLYNYPSAFNQPKFKALFGIFSSYNDDMVDNNKDHKGCLRNDEDKLSKPGPFLLLGIVVVLLAVQPIMNRMSGLETNGDGGAKNNGDGGAKNNGLIKSLMTDVLTFLEKYGIRVAMVVIVVLTVLVWYIDNIDSQFIIWDVITDYFSNKMDN